MVTKKDLIIAVLATFCLTVTIFMVIPTRSSTNPYDPWIDYNDDGQIGLSDLVSLASSYGTTGDPTKNVNVTNWRANDYDIYRGTLNYSVSSQTPLFFSGGRSRLGLILSPLELNIGANNNVTLALFGINWYSGPNYNYQSILEGPMYWFNYTIYSYEGAWGVNIPNPLLIDVKGPYFLLWFSVLRTNVPADWWLTFEYTIYLRNE
jgi:hypothetical protein